MENMSQEEIRNFLSHGTRTGKAGVIRKDGSPHVTPIWFILDGEQLVFNTWHESVKARSLKRDPRLTLCVDQEQPPYAFVMVEGTAELSSDPDQMLQFATRIAARYMGQDRAEEYGKRNSVEGELLVRVTPTKIIAKKGVSD
jgi:PPOX class probable F420-dependent enzyme